MLNILKGGTPSRLSENVHGFYSYYRPVTVTASSVGAAPVDVVAVASESYPV